MSGAVQALIGSLKAAAAGGDPNWSSVTLLLPGNGTNGAQNNTFIDSSANAFSITRNGNTTQGTFAPFSITPPYSTSIRGGSAYFDGSGDYLTVADNAALDMGSSNFTIEGWYYPLGSASVSTAIFSKRANSSTVGGVLLYYGSTGLTPSLLVDIGGSWAINTASSVSFVANQWNHFAVVRNGSAFNLYINGVSGVSASNAGSIPDNASAFAIGAMGADGSGPISVCYISNVRVVKGTAVYTAAFTPPTSPLTAITNTSLLLNFTNAGIIDNAMLNDLETVGNAQISTTQSKFGGSSMYFDGTGDYLTRPGNAIFDFGTGDFTIEAWVYPSATQTQFANIVCQGSTGNSWYLSFGTSNAVTFSTYAAVLLTSSSSLSNTTWTHVAVSRSGTALKMFFNGAQVASATDSTSLGITAALFVGFNNSAQYFNGYINDLRITKGVARYTANFTPPAAAFPTS